MGISAHVGGKGSLKQALWLRALALGVTFFLLSLLAERFVFPPTPSAVLWLPSGLSLAFLLRTPPRGWPALLAAIFLAEVASALAHGIGIPVRTALMWGLGNCLRTLCGAWLMRHLVGTSIRLSRSWEVAGLLLFGGLVSPIASATLGGLGVILWTGPFPMTHWVTWWLSDGWGRSS
jgi:integral membrane sensor domain MASE1